MTGNQRNFTARDIGKVLYNGDISSLEEFIKTRRWFKRKSETIKTIVFRDYAILNESPIQILSILEIFYEGFRSEIYYLPLMLIEDTPKNLKFEPIISLDVNGQNVLLYDAFENIHFCSNLLKLIKQNKQVKSLKGVFSFYPTGKGSLDKFIEHLNEEQIKLISTEQTNTSINYANSLIMKNFRNIEYGLNPDFEITYFLTKQTDLENVPALYGYIEYQNFEKMTATAAVLQQFIANTGDCWNYTLINYEQIYRIAMRHITVSKEDQIKEIILAFGKTFVDQMYKLGEVTGKFHEALTTDLEDKAFKAEFVTDQDIDCWEKSMAHSVGTILDKIERNLDSYSPDVQTKVKVILDNKNYFIDKVRRILLLKEEKQKKIRIHGDYHLGQVLKTKDDFVILDFEGEPIKTLEERRAKFLPQKDVAGMLRSFNYASYASLFEILNLGIGEEEMEHLKKWALIWEGLISESFLLGYLSVMKNELPKNGVFEQTLTAFKIDKAIYELDYEINNRPDWLKIPVEYLSSLL